MVLGSIPVPPHPPVEFLIDTDEQRSRADAIEVAERHNAAFKPSCPISRVLIPYMYGQ